MTQQSSYLFILVDLGPEKGNSLPTMSKDVEGFETPPSGTDDPFDSPDLKLFDRWTQKLRTWGVESRGVCDPAIILAS